MKAQYINVIAFCVGLIAAFLIGRYSIQCSNEEANKGHQNDSVVHYLNRIDTLKVERIKLKTIYEKEVDTIYLFDSVAIDSAYTKAIQKLIQSERAGFFK